MRPRLALAVTALVAVAAAVALGAGVGGAQTPPPMITTTAAATATGQSIAVTGENWPGGTLVNLEICGNNASNGSSDCAVATSQLVGATPEGKLTGFLLVTAPPSLCPCVVRATSQSSPVIATAPLSIADVGTALPGDAPGLPTLSRQLEVVGAQIRDEGSIAAWFGASPERTLVFTVRNTGDVVVRDAQVELAVGKGDDPSGFVEPPELGTIEVGQQATYEVPVDLGPLAFGEYTVVGEITGLTEPVSFSASTTHWPWALLLIPVIAVAQFLLLYARNRMRERVHAAKPEVVTPELVPGAVGALPTAEVIDLREGAEAAPAPGTGAPAVVGAGVMVAGVAGTTVVDRPPVTETIPGLDATIAEELGRALVAAFEEHGDQPLSDPDLVQVAAQLAHVTAVRTAKRHDLDMAMTRSLLVSVFAELTERLQVGDDLGDAVSTVQTNGTSNGSRPAVGTSA